MFDRLVEHALGAYDRIIGLDLSDCAIDGSLHKAPFGGDGTGPSPTDRGKHGWKWSMLTDRWGIPLGWTVEGANRHDSVLLGPLAATAARGLLTDIDTWHLDRGYDNSVVRRLVPRPASRIWCAPRAANRAPPPAPPDCPSGCDGPSSAPTRGC